MPDMFPETTAIYAAIFGLMMVVLSVLVVRQRFKQRVPLMDGGKLIVRQAMRIHGNFAEYVPMALVLVAFVELAGAMMWLVHLLGGGLLAGRLLHATGLKATKGPTLGRVSGMLLTYSVFAISSLWLIWTITTG